MPSSQKFLMEKGGMVCVLSPQTRVEISLLLAFLIKVRKNGQILRKVTKKTTLIGQSGPYQSQRCPLPSSSKRVGATGSWQNTHNLQANSATEAKAKAFII